ncbi:MAG: hypothetical protein Phog2KO_06690 [Phototrophicaceae bacterium]
MIVLVLGNLPSVLTVTNPINHLSVLLCLLFIYSVSNITQDDQSNFYWTGFTRLPVIMAWIIFSLPSAALVILLGTGITYLYKRYVANTEHDIRSYLPIAGNNSISILATHLSYLLMNGTFPQITMPINYSIISTVTIAIIIGSLASLLLIKLTQDIKVSRFIKNSDKYLIPEILIIMFSVALPILLFQSNLGLFSVAIFLITTQVFRSARVRQSEEELKRNLEEISIINNLSTTISSQLSLRPAIETLHRELDKLVDADTIYIGIYQEDQQSINFELVTVNGQVQDWKQYTLDNDLIGYVLREKQSICLSKDDAARLLKNLFDPQLLTEAQYMIAPLTVSTKLIGVLGLTHRSNPEAFSEHDFQIFKTVATQASLAIRNASLYDRTVRLADNLSVINQSLQDVMFNLDRVTSLSTACQIATSITRTTKAAVFLLEAESNNQLLLSESIGFETTHYQDSPTYQASEFKNGHEFFIVTDISKETDPKLIKKANLGEFEAFIQITLRSGSSIIGLLEVYHDSPYYYDTTEINLLKMLGNQIAAALDNADLLQALELYAAEQAQLVHLSRIAGGTLDLDTIIYEVCETLTHMMRVDRVAIGIWHSERSVLRLKSNNEVFKDLRQEDLTISKIPELSELLMPDTIASFRIFYEQESLSEDLLKYINRNHDTTLGVMPMRVEQDIIGLLILGSHQKRDFSDNEQRLLEMVNHQISVQILNALAHTDTQYQLVRGLEQLGLIEDITRQISQALELDIIIQNVLEAAIQSTQADFASISLPYPNRPKVFDTIWREVVNGELIPHRTLFELESGVIGHVMETGDTIHVPRNSEFQNYIVPENSENIYQSSLAVPLITRDKVIGVLNLESTYPDFFTQEQSDFINSLAGHTAISITNANLFNARENQIKVLNSLRELSLDALQVIHPEDIYDAVAHTTVALLGGDETALFRIANNDIQILHSLFISKETPQLLIDNISKQLLQDVSDSIQPKFIENIYEFEGQQPAVGVETKQKSVLLIPIVRRQVAREILYVGFNKSLDLSQIDLSIVSLLSVQVAGHLENAALNMEITSSNDRMRAILDSANDGIILLNNEHQIEDANYAASVLTYTDLDTYLFSPFKKIAYHNHLNDQNGDTWQHIIDTYEASPYSIDNQQYIFANDDELTHVKITVTDVQDEEQITVGRLLVLHDITEEKKLAAFRETMQSMVLHDLRGPLTAIVTSMYVAENILSLYDGTKFDELDYSLNKTFDVSLKSAEDMLRQVDTLRDLPMINQMTVDPQPITAYKIAQVAYESLSANFIESKISMEIDIDPDKMIYVDESLIRRVIVNLLHNAYKFTPLEGKVMIRLVETPENDNYFYMQIADNGPGIPEEQRERIFGQFIQIEGQKPRTGGKGTGLGLNFCKLAVEAHGGSIHVEADGPLSGACFAFSIPKSDWRN